jgi:hypothetical protein
MDRDQWEKHVTFPTMTVRWDPEETSPLSVEAN